MSLGRIADAEVALVQGVYGYGMDIGIIEPDLPAAPLDAHTSPSGFPQHFQEATPSGPGPGLQLSTRGVSLVSCQVAKRSGNPRTPSASR